LAKRRRRICGSEGQDVGEAKKESLQKRREAKGGEGRRAWGGEERARGVEEREIRAVKKGRLDRRKKRTWGLKGRELGQTKQERFVLWKRSQRK
jgi:hypothetical protein